jgi:hypothetical protein
MLEHHPNGALAHLRRKLRRIPGLVHCSILSKERASGKPGAVQFAETNVFDISRANSETIPAVKTPDKDRAKMPEDGLTPYPHLHRWLFLTFLIVATVVYNGPYHETGMVG